MFSLQLKAVAGRDISHMVETTRHPFLQGLSKYRGAPPTFLVIFGASGDLTARKLAPALYNLDIDHLLPAAFALVGYSRSATTEADFRQGIHDAIQQFSRRPLNENCWKSLQDRIFYHRGDYDGQVAFHSLAERLKQMESALGRDVQFLFYMATPPTVFKSVLENLGQSGLASHHRDTELASKVIVEKPFGWDLASAQELNQIIARRFVEHHIYRIDHYLGKETVQDLLVQRFANSIFEPIWNREYVAYVQITVAETIGVGNRGAYYDHSGALRDMIQNHTMQLLSLVAMGPPVSLDPEAIRDEKVKVLKAVQPPSLSSEQSDVVRARYEAGWIDGEPVVGYLQESQIPPHSWTETYAALRLFINNWRWKGVPFYLRSGKRLARRVSEIAICFKRPPGILFMEEDRFNIANNTLAISIQPDEGVTLLMNAKVPGLETRTQPVKMHFRHATTFGSNTSEAYERLILDAMIGDSTLFIRGDEAESSWRILTPVLKFWEQCGDRGLEHYAAGSWGPAASDSLMWENHHQWRQPSP